MGAKLVAVGDSGTQYNIGNTFQPLLGTDTAPIVSQLAGGTGYTVGNVLTVSGGTGMTTARQVQVTSVGASNAVTGLALVNYGLYTTPPNQRGAATTGGSGTGCTVNFNLDIRAPGTGYVVGNVLEPRAYRVDQSATLTVTAINAGGAIAAVSITTRGLYRYWDPAFDYALIGGAGTGATCRASVPTGNTSTLAFGGVLQNTMGGQVSFARGKCPNIRHEIWADITATGANRSAVYGDANAGSTGDIYASGANQGYAGDTATGTAKRRAQVLAMNPDIVRYAAGANVGATDAPVGTATAAIAAEVSAYVAAGKKVILSTIHPRSAGVRTTETNKLTFVSGSNLVLIKLTGHGMFAPTSGGEPVISNSVKITAPATIAGIDFSAGVFGRVKTDARNNLNQFVMLMPSNATTNVTDGGGTITLDRLPTETNFPVDHGYGFLPGNPFWQRYYDINTWIRANAASLGATLEDPWDLMRHPSPPSGEPGEADVGVLRDGAHSTSLGAARAEPALVAAINSIVQPGTWFDSNPANSNILGALAPFTASGGTAGLSVTGAIPSGWQVSNINGAGAPVQVVCSIEVDGTTGRNTLVLTCTSSGGGAAGTANNIRIAQIVPTATGFVPADWLQGFWNVEHIAGSPAGLSVTSSLGTGNIFSAVVSTRDFYQSGVLMPITGADRRWLMAPPMQADRRPNIKTQLDFLIRADIAGVTVIKVRDPILRIVGNPETEWPWVP